MKRRRRSCLSPAACLVALACSSPVAAPTGSPADGASPPAAADDVVFVADRPAALAVERAPTGHLLVHPRIDGIDAGCWIFDSGAGMCCVSTPMVESLHLHPADSVEATGIGGTATAQTYRAGELELGPLRLRDHPLLATDLSFLTPHLGEPIHGVIGYGVLSRCVVEFDFATSQLALYDPAHYQLAGAEWTELDLEGRTPAVRARFEGHEGLFQIDTGQNSAVVCSAAAVERWQLATRPGLRDAKVRGVGGDVQAKAGTLDWFEFGGVHQEHVDAVFLLEAKGSRSASARHGAIGTALLRPFLMITDYGNRRIAFRPRTAAPR